MKPSSYPLHVAVILRALVWQEPNSRNSHMTATRPPRTSALPRSAAAFVPAIPVRPRYDNWIAGEYVRPVLGQYFTNMTPITGEPLCEVARSGHEDVDRALDAAHAAAVSWNTSSPAYRATILSRIADRMESNLETLAFLETLDNGKPIRETGPPTCRLRSIISATSRAACGRRKGTSPSSTRIRGRQAGTEPAHRQDRLHR